MYHIEILLKYRYNGKYQYSSRVVRRERPNFRECLGKPQLQNCGGYFFIKYGLAGWRQNTKYKKKSSPLFCEPAANCFFEGKERKTLGGETFGVSMKRLEWVASNCQCCRGLCCATLSATLLTVQHYLQHC